MDEQTLYTALKEERIAGAGLDVLEEEPTPPDNPLLDVPNVVITPHPAAVSQQRAQWRIEFCCRNIRRVLAGTRPWPWSPTWTSAYAALDPGGLHEYGAAHLQVHVPVIR